MKAKRRRLAEDEEEQEEEESYIATVGTSVFFFAEVSKKNVLTLREKLEEAKKNIVENEFEKRRIYLYINSYGGDAYAGISGAHMIKTFPVKIVTIADGFVASSATLLFLSGKKRYITEFTLVLIHQLRTCFFGKYDEMKDEVINSTHLMNSLKSFYTSTTKLKPKMIDEYLKKEVSFSTAESLKYGLAHKII